MCSSFAVEVRFRDVARNDCFVAVVGAGESGPAFEEDVVEVGV